MIYTGGGDFKETGERFVQYFIDFADLKKNHSVLDIGSGIGRMAIPLTKLIEPQGEYFGVDLVPKGINWCKENISKNHPHFNFQLLDLDNDLYIKSDHKASNFTFPFEDQKFDIIILISVFTHMKLSETENYLMEIARMLKKGGHCFFSCFHYEDPSRLTSNPKFSFKDIREEYSYMDANVKMANVAINKRTLCKMIDGAGLKIIGDFEGNWDQPNKEAKDFQDIIVIRK